MHTSDDIYLGRAVAGGNPAGMQPNNESSPMDVGIGPTGRIFVWDVVPLALGTANVPALQTTAGAGPLVLTAGTGVTKTQDQTGTFRYVFDVERAVSLTSAANLSAINFIITGYDQYGQLMTQLIAGPNANTVTTTKAFLSVISVSASAAVGSNVSVGTSDRLGLPIAVKDAGYIVQIGWNNALAKDGGTFTAADATSPATNATGDVCGTYTPSSATNGTKRLVMSIVLSNAQVGPAGSTTAQRVAAYGVNQA